VDVDPESKPPVHVLPVTVTCRAAGTVATSSQEGTEGSMRQVEYHIPGVARRAFTAA
jgi:hypothetical protein